MIEKLTFEQEALIPAIVEKWTKILLTTEPIAHQKAEAAVKAAYTAIGQQEPAIRFFSSHNAARLAVFDRQPPHEIAQQLGAPLLLMPLFSELSGQIGKQLQPKLSQQLSSQIRSQLQQLANQPLIRLWEEQLNQQCLPQILPQMVDELGFAHYNLWLPTSEIYGVVWMDFCFSVLNCQHDPKQWDAFRLFISECGTIFPFEKTCIICDRPIKLLFDNEYRLHAEGEPAIEFADGYSLYLYRGVSLPEKYQIHPHQWQARWLLEEHNAELRRVLIQGIGYSRICQELHATELDAWQEYTLLKIDTEVDIEPIYLLKMTCPSTGFIHATRVPPNTSSARQAIRWVNWGVDPEEFVMQT
jgi:hypothetical protein